jgi:exodeoxyribonuclease VII large subunit
MMNQSMQYLDSVSRRLLHPGNRLTQNMNRVNQLKTGMLKNVDYQIQQLKHDLALKRIRFNNQRPNCNVKRSDLLNSMSALGSTMMSNLEIRKGRLESALRSLQQLNPENILSRGYCIVQTHEGIVVSDTRAVQPGNQVKIILKAGNLDATVNAVNA